MSGSSFPAFEELLEKPFSRIPQFNASEGRSGFGLGLALGVLFVPCAGPVLAAIVLAGATGTIGTATIVLTVSFAIGTAIPLLVFALAGQRVAERVGAFRRHQRRIRIVGGVVMLAFAVAIAFNLPATLQRIVPDYTSSLQDKVGGSQQIAEKLNLGGLVNDQNKDLDNCTNGGSTLENCGTAPDIKGITGWLNTPGNAPIDLKTLRGKVVLVDFWAYSCINCQRAIPHVTDWYGKYKDAGLEVIGVHSPEYAFEKVPGNVASGAADLGITYPVALDNNLSTWTNYRNRYWPAEYLIDADGTVRHIKFGEGDYDVTEDLIRQLLTQANPGITLPPPSDFADTTPQSGQTPETYFSVGKVVNYGGPGIYDKGEATFAYPATLAERCVRSARPVDPGLPGRHRRRGHVQHRAELQRQGRLPRRGRRGHGDRDPRRQDHHGPHQRPSHLTPTGGRRSHAARLTRSASEQGTPGVLLHLRVNPRGVAVQSTAPPVVR